MSTQFNEEAPHQAVVLVRWYNYERLPDGRCSAKDSKKGSELFTFTGKDFEETQNQVDKFLDRIKQNASKQDNQNKD